MSYGFGYLNCPFTTKSKAWTYMPVPLAPGAAPRLRPIDISDLKAHLKIDYIDSAQENYINMLIDAAVDRAERFTNRIFINQKWKTYRDFFTQIITLERGTNAVVNTFKYLNESSVLTDVPTDDYYTAVNDPYSRIILKDAFTYPQDILTQENSIVIEFTPGYGTTKDSVPATLRLLLCQHVTWLYENKGNCSVASLSPMLMDGYRQFKVYEVGAHNDDFNWPN